MNTDEELLTRALDRTAGRITAQTLRPLAEPGTAPPRRTRARRAIWNARLAPAAAAIAVVAVVAAALLVTSGSHRPGPAGAAAAPAAAGPPAYYAEVEAPKRFVPHIAAPGPTAVVVRSTATGAVVARIPTPAIPRAQQPVPLTVAAAPDGRTFYAVFANWHRAGGDYWIYRFRVTAAGTATRLTAISGGHVTGQDDLGNVGGIAVSPDGTRLALAVASVHDGSSQSAAAGEILVIDLRTGEHAVWRGGMARPGMTFGVESLSWTGNGRALAYLGEWCPPDDIVYGFEGGFGCFLGSTGKQPLQSTGTDVVREIQVTHGGGTLDSGSVLRRPAPSDGPLPVVIDPDGKEIITELPTGVPNQLEVVKTSVATGRVVQVMGVLPPFENLMGIGYLAADRTGHYALAYVPGTMAPDRTLHGWVHGGVYHSLAPVFVNGETLQVTW